MLELTFLFFDFLFIFLFKFLFLANFDNKNLFGLYLAKFNKILPILYNINVDSMI